MSNNQVKNQVMITALEDIIKEIDRALEKIGYDPKQEKEKTMTTRYIYISGPITDHPDYEAEFAEAEKIIKGPSRRDHYQSCKSEIVGWGQLVRIHALVCYIHLGS